jgi:NitT/TauT family transport system permease protein
MSWATTHPFATIAKPALALLLFLLLWQFGAAPAGIPEYVLPLPSEILARFWETRTAQFLQLGYTALSTLLGLALALAAGVLLALIVVYFKGLRSIVLPALAAFNSIPKIAVAPLLVIWFGLGLESKVVMAFLLAIFPIFVNSVSGLGEIEPDLLDLSRLSGGTPWRIFLKLRLPHATPYIADATKIAFPLALVGSIVGEFIGGNTGAGYLVLSAQVTIDTPLVFATLLSITIFAIIGIGAIALFERLFLAWRPSMRTR